MLPGSPPPPLHTGHKRIAFGTIGLLISTAQGAFNASGVFAAMIVLAVVALAADFLLSSLEKRLLKWRPAAF